ncbi:hypothetical protein D9M71_298460 [compost metagenome]
MPGRSTSRRRPSACTCTSSMATARMPSAPSSSRLARSRPLAVKRSPASASTTQSVPSWATAWLIWRACSLPSTLTKCTVCWALVAMGRSPLVSTTTLKLRHGPAIRLSKVACSFSI